MRNGERVLKELIAASNGKYNPNRIFSDEELKIATNNFDDQNFIEPDHHSNLYKGTWQERSITIMKFWEIRKIKQAAYERCINNIVYAAQMNHKHILKLIGCCIETPIPILVFESVEYRTLPERIDLYGDPQPRPQFEPLRLKYRLKIAMDIAHALAYLHVGFPRPIVFRHFMPSHISFNEQYVAKLFDFSFCISIPEGETHKFGRPWFDLILATNACMVNGKTLPSPCFGNRSCSWMGITPFLLSNPASTETDQRRRWFCRHKPSNA
ncbi:hypothetical protein WN944_007567 [Citrus x changshan-huyou]|uniref:Protein kinase domain-containing protein n=1 Tax=Citrus x changshan-huyou TaxID=2935761 RepID=A0AAP0MN64_9ROSI